MAGAVMCRVCLMVRGTILNIGGDFEVAYLNRVANSRVRSVRWAASTDLTFFLYPVVTIHMTNNFLLEVTRAFGRKPYYKL